MLNILYMLAGFTTIHINEPRPTHFEESHFLRHNTDMFSFRYYVGTNQLPTIAFHSQVSAIRGRVLHMRTVSCASTRITVRMRKTRPRIMSAYLGMECYSWKLVSPNIITKTKHVRIVPKEM